jgi:oxidase EvaA
LAARAFERLARDRAARTAELLAWLDARRAEVPFAAELIPLRQVANWRQDADGNFHHVTGQFFRIEGVRVTSAPGLREVSGWDQPILTQGEGGVLALLAREVEGRGVEFLLQAKADPGNIGYLQLCPTIQSTWENIRGLKGGGRAPLIEYLDHSDNVRVIYRAKHMRRGAATGASRTKT